jgi:hypothetical protein
MARLIFAFHALRNMITHGGRKEDHLVTYVINTEDPDIICDVFSAFVSDAKDD